MTSGQNDGDDPGRRLPGERPPAPQDVTRALGAGSQDARPERGRRTTRSPSPALSAVVGITCGIALLALSLWWSFSLPVAEHTGAGWTTLLLALTAVPALALLVSRIGALRGGAGARGWLLVYALVSCFLAAYLSLPHLASLLLAVVYAALAFLTMPGARPAAESRGTIGVIPGWLTRRRRQARRVRSCASEDPSPPALPPLPLPAQAHEPPAPPGVAAVAPPETTPPEAPDAPESPF